MSEASDDDLLAAIEADLHRQRDQAKAGKRKRHADRERASRQVAPELHAAAQKRYRERHPDKAAEQHRKQRDRVKADPQKLAQANAKKAAWKAANREKHNAHNRRYVARKKARQAAEALEAQGTPAVAPAIDDDVRAAVEAELARVSDRAARRRAYDRERSRLKYDSLPPEQRKLRNRKLVERRKRALKADPARAEAAKAADRARYHRRKGTLNGVRPPAPKTGPTLSFRVMQDQLYAACAAAVPKTIAPTVREDVIADLVVAVLEGDIRQDEVHLHAKRFIRAYDHRFQEWSLDAPIPGSDGKVTYLDRLAAPEPEHWLEAAE